MSKSTQARAIPTRTVIGYRHHDGTWYAATAHQRHGRVLIATAGVKGAPGVVEYNTTDRITWTPNIDGLKGVHWCKKCPETHPRWISTTKYAATYCTAQEKAGRERRKNPDYIPVNTIHRLQKEAQREQTIVTAIAHRRRTQAELIDATLANTWTSTMYPDDDKKMGRMAALATMYGITTEQAVERAAKHADARLAATPAA